jgi:hypothetical protein
VPTSRPGGRRGGSPPRRTHALTSSHAGVPVDLPPARNAIYIACTEQIVRYVGSTTRSVQARVREHVRLRERARWEELWVITLVDAISPYGVRLAEERVGKLLDPDDNRRPPGR